MMKTGSPTTTTTVLYNSPHNAALTEQMKELKGTVNILISQIQGLRSEVRQKNDEEIGDIQRKR
jgi:hypothetical protein